MRPNRQDRNAVEPDWLSHRPEPAPMLVVQPTLNMAATFFRVTGCLRCCVTPCLSSKSKTRAQGTVAIRFTPNNLMAVISRWSVQTLPPVWHRVPSGWCCLMRLTDTKVTTEGDAIDLAKEACRNILEPQVRYGQHADKSRVKSHRSGV